MERRSGITQRSSIKTDINIAVRYVFGHWLLLWLGKLAPPHEWAASQASSSSRSMKPFGTQGSKGKAFKHHGDAAG